MKADKNGTLNKGFTVAEQDFRRLVDAAKEQLLKKGGAEDLIYSFTVKFKNGAVYETDALDNVLGLENGGSESIKLLDSKIELKDKSYRIRCRYADPEYTDDEPKPIVYSVHGEDRDWVFVSSSQLEERLNTTTKIIAWKPKVEMSTLMSLFMVGFVASFMFVIDIDRERFYSWKYEKK